MGNLENQFQYFYKLLKSFYKIFKKKLSKKLMLIVFIIIILANFQRILDLINQYISPKEFRPAHNNEVLIVILPLNDKRTNKTSIDYSSLIANEISQVSERFISINLDNRYNFRDPQVITNEVPKTIKERESIGKKYNATLIISLYIDDLGIRTEVLIRNSGLNNNISESFRRVYGNLITFKNIEKDEILHQSIVSQANYLVLHGFGLIFYSNEEYISARTFFEKSIQLISNDESISNSIDVSPSYLILGDSIILEGNKSKESVENAIIYFKKVINTKSSSKFYKSKAHKSIGFWNYNIIGDNSNAIYNFSTAIKYNSNDPELYYYRGLALYAESLIERALLDFEKAIQYASANPEFAGRIQLLTGDIYYQIHDLEKAIIAYNKSLKFIHDDIIYLRLSEIHLKKCRFKLAQENLNSIINIDYKSQIKNQIEEFYKICSP